MSSRHQQCFLITISTYYILLLNEVHGICGNLPEHLECATLKACGYYNKISSNFHYHEQSTHHMYICRSTILNGTHAIRGETRRHLLDSHY